jgi:L-alanine-DL-glutamate epimerase-like enolase superfamily enzyme
VIESPLSPHQIRGYQALKKQGALPVFMDEGIILDEVVEEFIALEMLDGITIKTARSSGIWQSQKIIRMAKKHNMALLGSGLTDPDISLVASLHLFVWADIDRPCALNGPQFLDNTLVKNGLEQREDMIQIPQTPGLGIEMQPDAEKYLNLVQEM